MKMYIDLRTNKIMRAAGIAGDVPAAQILFKRGRAIPLELQFLLEGTTPIKVAANTLSFATKVVGQYDTDPLVHTTDWSIPADDDPDPVFVAYPSFTTAAVNNLFAVNADPSDDVASVVLMGEVNWSFDSGPLTGSATFELTVENDVLRSSDVTPTPLDAPDAYERKSNRGEPNGYAALNGNGVVVGVPVQMNFGFPFAPEGGEADTLLIAQSVAFLAAGHTVECIGVPDPAVVFTIKVNSVTVGTFTTAEGQAAVVLDAPFTTSTSLSKFELVAPASVIPSPFSVLLLLKGTTA